MLLNEVVLKRIWGQGTGLTGDAAGGCRINREIHVATAAQGVGLARQAFRIQRDAVRVAGTELAGNQH